MSVERFLRAIALSTFAAAQSVFTAAAVDTGAHACDKTDYTPHAIARITDTNAVVLDDGREVHLSGLLFPPAPMSVEIAEGTWPPAREANAALKKLLAKGSAQFSNPSAGERDRYGRPAVQMYVEDGGARLWLQQELIANGHAIVSSRSGAGACLAQLLLAEEKARREKRGLWANLSYRIFDATAPRDLERLRSNFVLVEGKVLNVTARSGRIYLGFGQDWKSDFTIVAPKLVLKTDPDASLRLMAMTGHNVRVRGWIERRYGPAIEIFSLADLEDLTMAATSALPQSAATPPLVSQAPP